MQSYHKSEDSQLEFPCDMSILSTQSDSSLIEIAFLDMSDRAGRHAEDLALLSTEEQARASRFHFERDRSMFVACRAALRQILAGRTGLEAKAIRFDLGACGKPALSSGQAGPCLEFNVSHSGDWFVCALSEAGPVGVDIEHVRPLDDMLAVARQFFSPAEVQRLFAIPESERLTSFFECWTRKEAVIKATGEGVSRRLDSFEVGFGPNVPPSLLRLDEQHSPDWTMESFRPAPEYVAALTAAFPFRTIVVVG